MWWDIPLILVATWIVATSVLWHFATLLEWRNKDDEMWDGDKHWAIGQLFDYHLEGRCPGLDAETEVFLRRIVYPDEQHWNEYDNQ